MRSEFQIRYEIAKFEDKLNKPLKSSDYRGNVNKAKTKEKIKILYWVLEEEDKLVKNYNKLRGADAL